jgi:hypothetical protein
MDMAVSLRSGDPFLKHIFNKTKTATPADVIRVTAQLVNAH